MRDPLGQITFKENSVIRKLGSSLPDSHFLFSKKAKELVTRGKLVNYKFTSEKKLESKKISFVSYPFEWCDEQFIDAASLTLEISRSILEDGFELKDCSAWNIIFDGNSPIFCDHLSFEKITSKKWWAFSQFIRHFIFTLGVSKYKKINAYTLFLFNRDGITPELAKKVWGFRRFFTKYWPLMIELPSPTKHSHSAFAKNITKDLQTETYHEKLYNFISWLLPKAENSYRKSTWGNYRFERDHYSTELSNIKYESIKRWLNEIKPKCTVDLGCNSGEFSFLASEAGSEVIAIDVDHEVITKLYRESKDKNLKITTVITDLDDISGGRGWSGKEFKSLPERLEQQADVLMMLAIVHHIAISSSIPYEKIAEFTSKISKKYLIIEVLEESDSQVKILAANRNRAASDFSINYQFTALLKYFSICEEIELGTRRLLLMKRI